MGVVELVTGIYGSASRGTCVCVWGGGVPKARRRAPPPPSCGYTKLWLKNNLQVGGYYIFKHDRKRILIFKYMMKEKSKKKNRKIFFLTQRTSWFFKPVTVRNSIVNLRITKIFFLCLKMQQTKLRSPKLHKITQWISMITNKIKMDIFLNLSHIYYWFIRTEE